MNAIQTVNFHNQPLITLQKDGIAYVAMKPICENIGLDWTAQRQRLMRDEVLNSTMVIITTVGNDGKNRKMLCLPIHYLNGWLFGVDVSRVKAEIKDKLITYKKECYQALFDYWNNGMAVNPRRITITPAQQQAIRQAVAKRCKSNSTHYQSIYTAVHGKFNIPRYDELLAKDFDDALAFIEQYPLDGSSADNAFWRMVGILEYERLSRELDALEQALDSASAHLNHIKRTKGLLYDAFGEQRHISHDPNLTAKARAFIDAQMAMKRRIGFI